MGQLPASFYPDSEIPVLVLRGSAFEMGYQRGRLFSEDIRNIIEYYRSLPVRLLGRTRFGRSKLLSSLAATALNSSYRLPLSKNLLPAVEDELRGVCEGAGLAYEEVYPLVFLPDIVLNLVSAAMKGQEAIAQLAASFPAIVGGSRNLGCTSLAAWGDATARRTKGKLVVGRNLDFLGLEQLASHPLLVLYEPDDGQRYLTATATGVPTGGITSMNESGITVAIHLNFSMDCSLSGTNMMNIANEVVRKARSLDEAVEIALALKATTGFTLFMTSGDERRAAAVEYSSRRAVVRYPTGETASQTNHYLDDELCKREVKSLILQRQTEGRMVRCNALLKEHYGRIGPREMAIFLGDRFDVVAGRERTIGNMISQPSTTLSVVMVPEERRIYFARNSPQDRLSPASQGPFYGYTLDEIVRGDLAKKRKVLRGSTFASRKPDEHRGHELFMEGMLSFYESGDYRFALEKVNEACAAGGEEPFHFYVKGLLEISRAMRGGGGSARRFSGALSSLDRGLKAAAGSPYLESYGRFLLGRTYLALDEAEHLEQQLNSLELLAQRDPTANEFHERLLKMRRRGKAPFVPGEPEELLLEYVGII